MKEYLMLVLVFVGIVIVLMLGGSLGFVLDSVSHRLDSEAEPTWSWSCTKVSGRPEMWVCVDPITGCNEMLRPNDSFPRKKPDGEQYCGELIKEQPK